MCVCVSVCNVQRTGASNFSYHLMPRSLVPLDSISNDLILTYCIYFRSYPTDILFSFWKGETTRDTDILTKKISPSLILGATHSSSCVLSLHSNPLLSSPLHIVQGEVTTVCDASWPAFVPYNKLVRKVKQGSADHQPTAISRTLLTSHIILLFYFAPFLLPSL